MRRATIPVLVIAVGLLLFTDLLVVNPAVGAVAGVLVTAVILVAAGAALATGLTLAARRSLDLWRRRGDPIGAVAVLAGIVAVLVAGLRPGSAGTADPAVGWIVGALIIPIGASLFGLLFVSTLAAARRSAVSGGREGLVLVGAALVLVVALLPIGGGLGTALSGLAALALSVPIAGVFRGILIGIAITAAILATRTMFGIGPADE